MTCNHFDGIVYVVKIAFFRLYLFSSLILWKERFAYFSANREFNLDKYTTPKLCQLPSVTELRAALLASEGSEVKQQIASLFDEDTFVELSAYTKRGYSQFLNTEKTNEFEGVICGYGAIDGKLVFAFAEDAERMGGAIDDRHAKKICDLYKLATENGAPVIGIFNSNGIDVFEGTAGLAAYGRIMTAVTKASGVIPQIAFISGKCIGTCAAIASLFDIVVKDKNATFYVSSPVLTNIEGAQDDVIALNDNFDDCIRYIKSLISFLPCNSSIGIQAADVCTDNLNRKLGDTDFGGQAADVISAIADNGVYYELSAGFAKVATTAFTTIGGVRCGVVATSFAIDEGRITSDAAKKIAKFVNFCDSFSIPVVTLVDSLGLAIDAENEHCFAPEIGRLIFSYASSAVPKVTVILNHAIGASFVLLGSKSLGADIVYTLDNAEIGALNANSGVAFAWDQYITEKKTRESLIEDWKMSVSSPVHAAESGEIDDIISVNELRARICSALLMLSYKGAHCSVARRKVLPL